MPVEITVGPPILTINQGNTFMVTDLKGEIQAESEMGLFSHDTRFVNYYKITANGQRWNKLSSATVSHFAARLYYTNEEFNTEFGSISKNSLAMDVYRQVSNGIDEHFTIVNYSKSDISFNLEIAIRCDFADIFEVRQHNFFHRGRITTEWLEEEHELRMQYTNRDFGRCYVYRVVSCETPAHYANGRVTFEVKLEPRQRWEARARHILMSSSIDSPEKVGGDPTPISDEGRMQELHDRWYESATRLKCWNEEVYRLYKQSVDDFAALRLYEDEQNVDEWIAGAGVPWYVTLFGRDSLIASLQAMMVNPRFARGTLTELAKWQAREFDDHRDAEPGKILHEIRYGELAHFKRIPHTPYYGGHDQTSLYLITLNEAWKWRGDEKLLYELRDPALRCLEWIEKHGDLDGDGFQEYKTRSKQGYENMGWKDSGDAIVYPDGSNVTQPKALCELQGYVFDAWMRASEIFAVLGDSTLARELVQKARRLHERFEEAFWCEDIGFYALTLDAKKHPVKSVASNAGHCLWSGIVSRKNAGAVVKRFFEPDMWSGWGIRTISSENGAFNPHSYHLGSIWPHDNGIIALGFKRYGFADEAARVARDISRAASCFINHRLPELYAGIARTENSFPVQYMSANVPQAWAAGSVFHLLQAILGIQADAPNGRLYVDPALPHWLHDMHIEGLSVGDAEVELHFRRQDQLTSWEAKVTGGRLEVLHRAWQPWVDQF